MNRSSASANVWHITEISHTRAHSYLYYTWWDDSNTGAQPSPTGALRHRDAGLRPQKAPHRCCGCLVSSWSWGSQTALHNLQNPRALSSCLSYCSCPRLLTSNSTQLWRILSLVSFVTTSSTARAKNTFHIQVRACRTLYTAPAFLTTINMLEEDNPLHAHF